MIVSSAWPLCSLIPPDFRHFNPFFIKFHQLFDVLCTHMPILVTITHPLIPINFLLNTVDFRICPMPLGQQSITPSVFHSISTGFLPVHPLSAHPSATPSIWAWSPPTHPPVPSKSAWAPCPLSIHPSTCLPACLGLVPSLSIITT